MGNRLQTSPADLPLSKRLARGKALRRRVPRSAHGNWQPAA
jgi:hypothetical protein